MQLAIGRTFLFAFAFTACTASFQWMNECTIGGGCKNLPGKSSQKIYSHLAIQMYF